MSKTDKITEEQFREAQSVLPYTCPGRTKVSFIKKGYLEDQELLKELRTFKLFERRYKYLLEALKDIIYEGEVTYEDIQEILGNVPFV
jgi:hypothetical protein